MPMMAISLFYIATAVQVKAIYQQADINDRFAVKVNSPSLANIRVVANKIVWITRRIASVALK